MRRTPTYEIVPASLATRPSEEPMEPVIVRVKDDSGLELDRHAYERTVVRAWRTEQLQRLGLPRPMADVFADAVDWHDLAALVSRGCPPALALQIVH